MATIAGVWIAEASKFIQPPDAWATSRVTTMGALLGVLLASTTLTLGTIQDA